MSITFYNLLISLFIVGNLKEYEIIFLFFIPYNKILHALNGISNKYLKETRS